MKKYAKLLIFMPILFSFAALASCNNDSANKNPSEQENGGNQDNGGQPGGNPDDNNGGNTDNGDEIDPNAFDPIGLKEFINGIHTDKNYTYTYEYYSRKDNKSEHELVFKYEDKYTKQGMFSKVIKDKDNATSFGWMVNEKDGTFPFTIDENNAVKPGKALRDINRDKVPSYFDEVIALDDMRYTNTDNYSRYQSKYNFKFNDLDDKVAFLEASQIKNRVVANNKVIATMDVANKNYVKLKIQIGINDYVEGAITKVGTTTIPEISDYLTAGKGALVSNEVDPGYQAIIDKFKSYNYETPLFSTTIIGGYRPQVGITKIYKKTSSDGKTTAIVKFDDYEENNESLLDKGLIQLTTENSSVVYEFKVTLDGEFVLGEPFKKGEETFATIDDFYAIPTSLSMLNDDAKIIEYVEGSNAYGTKDTFIVYEVCKYLGFEASIKDLPPYSVALFPSYDEKDQDTLNAVILSYFWDDQRGSYGQSDLLYTNFGKVSLPFIDEYLEVK